MSLAAILVHAEPDPSSEPRLRLAADLADQLEAALIGVAVEGLEGISEGAPPNPAGRSLVDAVGRRIQADIASAEALFRRVCGDVKKGVEWRAFTGAPGRVLASQARAAELVVCGVGGQAPDPIDRRASPSDLVMTAGRPVLTGPADVDRLDLSRIVLAWKDTRESRRALADAMPLLLRAERVLVVAAPEHGGDEECNIALADVADTIRRHGGSASVRLLTGAASPADGVLEAAVNFDAQLVVAGAYGHSRMREWAFGGVTQRLLRQEAKFVLLSH